MMGVLTYFLRCQIKQSERGISINQEKYVKDLLKKYDINSSSVKTLMVPPNNLRPDLSGKAVNETQYRDMSSAEAKYVAAAGCYANILWMKSQLTDYDIIYEKVPIFYDNTSAIAISNNLVLHSRTKYIDIKDHILKGDIELHFIPTQYQLADIFTKPLDEPTLKRLIVELGHDASTDSTAKADPVLSAPNDSKPTQQDQTKSADGLKPAHTYSGTNEESRADDISKKIKLGDLSNLLKDTISALFTPDSLQDEPIIVSDESKEEEEVIKDKDTHASSHDVPKDTSIPYHPSPKSA
ncbi:hypothetical protein Tco_1389227 [Tanacetum coccineum]